MNTFWKALESDGSDQQPRDTHCAYAGCSVGVAAGGGTEDAVVTGGEVPPLQPPLPTQVCPGLQTPQRFPIVQALAVLPQHTAFPS